MKVFKVLFLTVVMALFATSMAMAADPCATIQSGSIKDVNGNVVRTGYDQWGYNYQAHMFNGFYENYGRPYPPLAESPSDTFLQMKWSDTWISNKDCDSDNKLDRGLGTDTPGYSQGWLTNHMHGSYIGDDGETHNWTEFTKIVYMPTGCDNPIWTVYCIIEDIYNDPYGGFSGIYIKDSLVNPGLGFYTD